MQTFKIHLDHEHNLQRKNHQQCKLYLVTHVDDGNRQTNTL